MLFKKGRQQGKRWKQTAIIVLFTGMAGLLPYSAAGAIGALAGYIAPVDHDSGQKKLDYWEITAREADCKITGVEKPLGRDYEVWDKHSNDRRMKQMVSMSPNGIQCEFYAIGKNYKPDTLIIGQTFSKQVIYSNTTVDSFYFQGVYYTISRIGIKKIQELDETVVPEGDYYAYGDTIQRRVGQKTYSFRCIDEDYRDSMGNYETVALFLCDSIIGADINRNDTSLNLISFGENNNYRNSQVRSWLQTNTPDYWESPAVLTGAQNAYGGNTEQGAFEQMGEDRLLSYPLYWQKAEDTLFLLSVEEAVAYRRELWRFGGSHENNPEAVYRPFAKGYYLRTPLYEELGGKFCYGSGIYAVDLLGGNIRAVDVSYTTMGIRPAFVLPNQ